MARDWAELPLELIESISKKLTVYADYIQFRSVCRWWRFAAAKTPLHLPPQSPCLILSPSTFFDLSTTKTHHLPLNLPPSRICGSSHGWLVTLDETPNSPMRLLNPFSLASISLPKLDFSDVVQVYTMNNAGPCDFRLMEFRSFFSIRKVVLSSSPLQNENFTACALVRKHYLAFWNKHFRFWDLDFGYMRFWEDVVYHDGYGLFFAVSKEGTIAVCNVDSSEGAQVQIIGTEPGQYYETAGRFSGDINYAVFSGDDLLLVTRALNQDAGGGGEANRVCRTVGFEVFKMDWEESKWDKIETLGDKVLFVGGNNSHSFSASDFGGCFEADCIYFTGHYPESNHDDSCGKHDLGIFRLQDQSIETLPCFPQNSPIWITPNPF